MTNTGLTAPLPAPSLWDLGLSTIKELETEQGILASGRDEIYGCIFGRDSLITSLKLLKAYRKTGDAYFLGLVKKILLNLLALQGRDINIESGEEPGKCIHEFRPNNHEHLTKSAKPWYLYPDNVMRNYDTIDATPLLLIAIKQYYEAGRDGDFLSHAMPGVEKALDWILLYSDTNADGLIDYRFHPQRTYGGLVTQSWMDSAESLFHEDGTEVIYPIAPVEAQAYAYVALRAWADHMGKVDPNRAALLDSRADDLRRLFAEKFVVAENGETFLAFAVDGTGRPLKSARSSMGHCLWAAWKRAGGGIDCIVGQPLIPKIVDRLMAKDLFEPSAGIRTLSALSSKFNPESYHNGSIWPHDTAMLIEGLENFGYAPEAARARQALLRAYAHFQTPIELFVFQEDRFMEYRTPEGRTACRKQAWSAASLLAEAEISGLVTDPGFRQEFAKT